MWRCSVVTPRHVWYRTPSFFMTMQSHTAAAVTDLLRLWQWEILEHPPYSLHVSSCDYDLFAKVKEPLRGIRDNTRYKLIRAIGWSIRNINKDGRADGVHRFTNIWEKVINKAATILKAHKCCTPVNKAMSEI